MSNESTQTQARSKDALDELIDHTKSRVECSPMKVSDEGRMMLDLESRPRSKSR